MTRDAVAVDNEYSSDSDQITTESSITIMITVLGLYQSNSQAKNKRGAKTRVHNAHSLSELLMLLDNK